MKCLKDDLFTVYDKKLIDEANFLVCTTNCMIKNDGKLVMGAGIAKEFARRYPSIARQWGRDQLLHNLSDNAGRDGKSHPHLLFYQNEPTIVDFNTTIYYPIIIGFPTKIDWRDNSDINLIEKMLIKLKQYFYLRKIQTNCLIPKLGCSNGGLEWKDIRPLMEKYLDDRFICCLNE